MSLVAKYILNVVRCVSFSCLLLTTTGQRGEGVVYVHLGYVIVTYVQFCNSHVYVT